MFADRATRAYILRENRSGMEKTGVELMSRLSFNSTGFFNRLAVVKVINVEIEQFTDGKHGTI